MLAPSAIDGRTSPDPHPDDDRLSSRSLTLSHIGTGNWRDGSAVSLTALVTATFTTPNGGQTVGSYSGIVRLTVSGVGQSLGTSFNDAFYQTPSGSFIDGYYQLAFGTSPLQAFSPGNAAANSVVGGLPAFSPTNVYTFLLNTGLSTPGTLYFGVTDGAYGDNTGAFTINVAAVPEPATWGMMILGFGAVGAAMRRRSKVRTTVRYA